MNLDQVLEMTEVKELLKQKEASITSFIYYNYIE